MKGKGLAVGLWLEDWPLGSLARSPGVGRGWVREGSDRWIVDGEKVGDSWDALVGGSRGGDLGEALARIYGRHWRWCGAICRLFSLSL